MITTKEAITNYRRIMMDTDIAYKSAGQEVKTREKQVYIQTECLDKAVASLKEVAVTLEDSLEAVLGTEREDEEGIKGTTEEKLCGHASFLRSKVCEITTVTYDLTELIRRLEI